jgi:hypothetical protein
VKRPGGTGSFERMLSVAADGMVSCPLRGDCDVERCVQCQYLEGAERRGTVLIIHCRRARADGADNELLTALRF